MKIKFLDDKNIKQYDFRYYYIFWLVKDHINYIYLRNSYTFLELFYEFKNSYNTMLFKNSDSPSNSNSTLNMFRILNNYMINNINSRTD